MEEIQDVKEPEPMKEEESQPEPEKSQNLVDDAILAKERLERENTRLEANIKRLEALQVEKALGGKADVKVEKQEESAQDYAKRVLQGDGE